MPCSKTISNKLYLKKYRYRTIISAIRNKCHKFNIPCTINMAWGNTTYTGYCSITGIPFVIIPGKCNPYHPSVDRINPTKGYVIENCRWGFVLCKFI